MPIKYIPYYPNTVEGQAILDNITRTQRVLRYRENDKVYDRIKRGMPYYEVEPLETVGEPSENLVIRGECISACAYLKEQGIKVDLVYIDPPFASGADYAKKVYLRRNLKLSEKIKSFENSIQEKITELQKTSEELGEDFSQDLQIDLEELRNFEETMYGDIWQKEDYLNWMYENLMAIKSIMSEKGAIFVHLDWNIGHYVKILMDEVFGEENFRNEIYWYYYNKLHGSTKQVFPRATDSIFYYLKNSDEDFTFHHLTEERDKPIKKLKYSFKGGKIVNDKDENGKSISYISTERQIDNVWRIRCLQPANQQEWIDYPTQKPQDLLERILNSASDEGMVVADFFGGSGALSRAANSLNRKFIHVDVNFNSIQITRDKLVEAGASCNILDIKDGVSLFRNPQQTMDKLATLIPGLQKGVKGISNFWFGAITKSKEGIVPVYVPNLLNTQEKVLDIPTINTIINQELQNLEVNAKKVIVYYIDIDDQKALEKFIKDNNATEIEVELKDLKNLLHYVVIEDIIDFKTTKTKDGYETEINKFISDRLIQKIGEFNQKGNLQSVAKGKKFNPINISEEGLELIELIALDCENKEGKWHSTTEIKIDKLGYVITNGVKSKNFWDGKIISHKKPLRIKVRNISGDETIKVIE